MNSSEYWKKRAEQITGDQFQKVEWYEQALQREYQRVSNMIDDDINVFYLRYSVNGDMSMSEARKQLSGKELNEFKMTLEQFTELARSNADGLWTKELNSVYFRTRVSRLEALQIQINNRINTLAGSRQDGAREVIDDAYKDTYYRTIFELQTGTGIGVSFAKIDEVGMERVFKTKFLGSDFSERIWNDRDKLTYELKAKMSQAFIRGDGVRELTKAMSERMGVSLGNARRLINTETAFFVGQATMDGYKQSGVVDRYEILATLDKRTSEICQGMDGKIFRLSEMEVNINYPPFHANCRTTTIPYFEDEIEPGRRIAEDSYFVPGDMKYKQWFEQYAA